MKCWWVWLAENHLHSKWHYFMGRQMYKSSEEKEYKQTSAEGEVGQTSPTAPEVCMPQSHSHEYYGKSSLQLLIYQAITLGTVLRER